MLFQNLTRTGKWGWVLAHRSNAFFLAWHAQDPGLNSYGHKNPRRKQNAWGKGSLGKDQLGKLEDLCVLPQNPQKKLGLVVCL